MWFLFPVKLINVFNQVSTVYLSTLMPRQGEEIYVIGVWKCSSDEILWNRINFVLKGHGNVYINNSFFKSMCVEGASGEYTRVELKIG